MGRLKSVPLCGSAAIFFALALAWFVWPWLRPWVWPAGGPPWLVVLDGYHRLDVALGRQARTSEAILLITCPSTGQPTTAQRQFSPKPLVVLHEGFDTATQAVALASWSRRRAEAGTASPRQIVLVSDAHHVPRATLAAQIAVGGGGTHVISLSASPALGAGSWREWPVWRDAVRLQLWRLTGSTGAVLNAPKLQSKVKACFQTT